MKTLVKKALNQTETLVQTLIKLICNTMHLLYPGNGFTNHYKRSTVTAYLLYVSQDFSEKKSSLQYFHVYLRYSLQIAPATILTACGNTICLNPAKNRIRFSIPCKKLTAEMIQQCYSNCCTATVRQLLAISHSLW